MASMSFRLLSLLTLLLLSQVTSAPAQSREVLAAAWSENSRYLVTLGPERIVRVHDGTTGEVLKTTRAPGDATTYYSFSPDSGWEEPNHLFNLRVSGETAVCGSTDEQIFWWSLPDLKPLAATTSSYSLTALALGQQGRTALCVSTSTRYLDSSFQLFRLGDKGFEGYELPDLPPPDSSSSYQSPQLSPDGRWACAWTGEKFQFWELGPETAQSLEMEDISSPLLGNTYLYDSKDNIITIRSYQSPALVLKQLSCGQVRSSWVNTEETRLVNLTTDGLELWELNSLDNGPTRKWAQTAKRITVSPDGRKVILWHEKHLTVGDLDNLKTLYDLPLEEPR